MRSARKVRAPANARSRRASPPLLFDRPGHLRDCGSIRHTSRPRRQSSVEDRRSRSRGVHRQRTERRFGVSSLAAERRPKVRALRWTAPSRHHGDRAQPSVLCPASVDNRRRASETNRSADLRRLAVGVARSRSDLGGARETASREELVGNCRAARMQPNDHAAVNTVVIQIVIHCMTVVLQSPCGTQCPAR